MRETEECGADQRIRELNERLALRVMELAAVNAELDAFTLIQFP